MDEEILAPCADSGQETLEVVDWAGTERIADDRDLLAASTGVAVELGLRPLLVAGVASRMLQSDEFDASLEQAASVCHGVLPALEGESLGIVSEEAAVSHAEERVGIDRICQAWRVMRRLVRLPVTDEHERSLGNRERAVHGSPLSGRR